MQRWWAGHGLEEGAQALGTYGHLSQLWRPCLLTDTLLPPPSSQLCLPLCLLRE